MPKNPGQIRLPANNIKINLPAQQIAGHIETCENNGRLASIRAKAEMKALEPALVQAMLIIENAQHIASYEPQAPQKAYKLEPFLIQDATMPPKIFAQMPEDYSEALDMKGTPVRWNMPANILYGYNKPGIHRQEKEDTESKIITQAPVRTPVNYRQLVEDCAKRYNLSPALIMAIIHSESNFRPSLVSQKSAMGLMQLLPSTASGEVHKFLYGKSGNINFNELSIPETNIRYGTAYLHILLKRYFSDVKDRDMRELCAIAAYNLGPNRFIKLYGSTPETAAEMINKMSPETFYTDLSNRLPTRETRFYIAKVRRMKDLYSQMQ